MSNDESNGMSLKMVGIMVFLLVSYLLWGGAAAIHKGHLDQSETALQDENGDGIQAFEGDGANQPIRLRRRLGLVQVVIVTITGVWTFVTNSFAQIVNLPQMIPYMLKERQGYLMFCGAVLALTGLGMFGMAQMQKSLEAGNPFSKNRKVQRTPGTKKKKLKHN